MSYLDVADTLPGVCRSLLQAGIGLAFQSTLLLGLGLLAGWALRRRGPALASLIYRATLGGTLLGVLFSCLLGGFLSPLWCVSLPLPAPGSVRDARPVLLRGPAALAE